MKSKTKKKMARILIGFGVFCYLVNYYVLIFFQRFILERFAESAEMVALWPTYLWFALVMIASFLLDSAEDLSKEEKNELQARK